MSKKGIVYLNPTAKWALAPLLVPKPGPAAFRFTVDLRPVNKYTVKQAITAPPIEIELHKLANSYGVYTPTRVMHGTANATAHMHSALQAAIPEDLHKSFLAWVDDILLHSKNVVGLLNATRKLFDMCKLHNMKLHLAKCTLYATSIRWCGRIISKDGIRFDPRSYKGYWKWRYQKMAHIYNNSYAQCSG
eukprot:IDg22675t1